MANSAVTIYLQQVYCNSTSENGKDEVYIKYSVDGGRDTRFPSSGYHSMSHDEYNPWVVNLPITYKDTLVIGLYDSDTLGDESLGSHSYTNGDAASNEQNPVSNSNGANYTLFTGPAAQ